MRGEKILILRQTTADWWWGERAGCCGYIPANHLGKQLEDWDPEDSWQDEEYFGSYGTLVRLLPTQPGAAACHSLVLGSNFKNNFRASAQLFRVGPADVFFSSAAQLCHPSAEADLKISVSRSAFQ